MSILEEDGFVLVSKEGLLHDDDLLSISSSRSSLFLVEDPSLDNIDLNDEADAREPEKGEVPASDETAPAEEQQLAEDDAPTADTAEQAPQAVPKQQPKYVCSGCSSDLAARADVIWEGYMGANKAAFLFSKVLNTESSAEPRKQQLSTGVFLLQDVHCKTCSVPLGWSYIKSWNEEQKYKEGTTIVQQSLLQLVGEATS